MLFASLKSKLFSFLGTIVKQVYNSAAFSAAHAFQKTLPTTGTKAYEILGAFCDPDDAFAFELDYIVVVERIQKAVQVGYFSKVPFSSAQQAKDAMQFDLATAMTTCMPGIYENPRNVYGIMSSYQQERLDRQEYEFIDYSQELNNDIIKQEALQMGNSQEQPVEQGQQQQEAQVFKPKPVLLGLRGAKGLAIHRKKNRSCQGIRTAVPLFENDREENPGPEARQRKWYILVIAIVVLFQGLAKCVVGTLKFVYWVLILLFGLSNTYFLYLHYSEGWPIVAKTTYLLSPDFDQEFKVV
ncbi:hypothetical protein BD408DRAFT_432543 [Parasitella parasitica]|nr:hypothetical protein BD408DRAFT_432543 [Parasitella parasitica]